MRERSERVALSNWAELTPELLKILHSRVRAVPEHQGGRWGNTEARWAQTKAHHPPAASWPINIIKSTKPFTKSKSSLRDRNDIEIGYNNKKEIGYKLSY